MKIIGAILLLAAISVSGCDMLHVKQYRIAGVTANSPDAAKLKAILQNIAAKTGLKDHTSDSSMTNILVFLPRQTYTASLASVLGSIKMMFGYNFLVVTESHLRLSKPTVYCSQFFRQNLVLDFPFHQNHFLE